MAERKRIGIIYIYDERWAGGMYYIQNIIHALNHLEDSRKPEIIIFYGNKDIKDKLDPSIYPYLSFLPFNKPRNPGTKILSRAIGLIKKGYLLYSQYPADLVDFVFPCDYMFNHQYNSFQNLRKIYWIPDFQHKHLPQFFTKEELDFRDRAFGTLAGMKAKLVLSSENAKADLLKFFPNPKCSVQVLPFAVVLPEIRHINVHKLRENFGIHGAYFFSPNQFWAHKNHMVILKAIALLKNKQLEYQVVFTGKEYDNRNVEYFITLKQFIDEQSIGQYVKILGFIDRLELLGLMKDASAVVQPSLFEGWSTVVEDAKAMEQTIILSDLPVHREQAGDLALFFDPHNEVELATQMEKCLLERVKFKYPPYADTVVDYASEIIEL